MRLWILVAGIVMFSGVTTNATYGTFAADQSTTQPKPKRIIMEEGWDIPGLGQSKLVAHRKPVEFNIDNPIRLYLTTFKPKHEVIVSVPLYYSVHDDGRTLVMTQEQVSIISIIKYELNGKAFCYEAPVCIVLVDKKNGAKGYGGKLRLRYYDEDGDGKFESYDLGGGNPPFIPKIPEWVQR